MLAISMGRNLRAVKPRKYNAKWEHPFWGGILVEISLGIIFGALEGPTRHCHLQLENRFWGKYFVGLVWGMGRGFRALNGG